MSLNRKIIYIEIDEEINSVIDRIKKVKEKDIFLVVPSKALLFQSILNLKILQTKTENLDKNLILVTKDYRGQSLSKSAGIKVKAEVENNSTRHEIKIKINSIDAYRNDIEDTKPIQKDSKKVSIGDLVGKVSQKLKSKKEALASDYNFYDFYLNKPNRKGLIAILLISMSLFFFISYIALPGATVYIQPKSDVIETGVNIELADAKVNQKIFEENPPYMVPTFEVEAVFEKKLGFDVISSVFEGTNAKGKIKLINTTNQEWTLRPQTRFQSQDGLIFRSTAWVKVPVQKSDEEPGIAHVTIEADEFDIYKEVIGQRGNIAPSKLTIPGLSQYNQKLIWGEIEEPTQGGITKWSKLVKQEDIDAAIRKAESDLLKTAKEDITDYVQKQNEINKVSLVLLDDPKYITKEVLEIRVPEKIIGTKLDVIDIYTKIKVTAISYDETKFKQILRGVLMSKAHPDMQIREINYDNVGYDIIDENKILKIIKISATINGREEYTFDSNTESGLRMINKIKTAVVGMSKADAENYITNLKEVSESNISTWPFFTTSMPGLPENIEVKLMEN